MTTSTAFTPVMNQGFMLQAISVRFLCPTNTLGSRWKASAAAGSITLQNNYSMNPEENAIAAAQALVSKFDWDQNGSSLAGGQLYTGDYSFVMLDSRVQRSQVGE